jgi:isopropylmalate/homocitrate/citramalate synthase
VKATICDVGPRDGLQDEPEPLSVPARAELVNRLAAVGVPRIEAASFVHPERVPQMAGAEEVAVGIEPLDGTIYAGLVLNEKGYERLATTALDEVHFGFGASVVVSAAARLRLGRPGTSQPRTSCTSCTARESRPASTWKG